MEFPLWVFFFLKRKCIIKVVALFIREANEIITAVTESTQHSVSSKHCLRNSGSSPWDRGLLYFSL